MEKLKKKTGWLLAVILLSYFVVGFPDGSFTVSWLGIAYDIQGMTTAHTGWILVGYSVTYTLAGVILAWANRFLKLQTIYLIGLVVMAMGFVGLALSFSFAFVVGFISLYGFGAGAMASSMNSYMAKHFTARHNNYMHFFWGGGAAISPVIMGQMMIAHSWRAGYFVIVAILGVVAVMILVSMYKKIWIDEQTEIKEVELTQKKQKKYLTKKKHQNIQILTFFFLGGTDYTLVFFTGAALIARGYPYYGVAIFSAVYYMFTTIGCAVAGWGAKRLKEVSIIRLAAAIAIAGIGVLYFTGNVVGMAIVGFGIGPLLPTLVSDTSNAFKPAVLPKIVGYELAAFGTGIAVLFFITSQILYFVSYEALFPLGVIFVVLVFVCNEILERDYNKINKDFA